MSQLTSPQQAKVHRQIVLPLSKAIEIAYKSIRMRLSRSLLVTSGIVLALAFLVSIQTSETVVQGMRHWIATAPTTSRFMALKTERDQLEQSVASTAVTLRARVRETAAPSPDQPKFDPKKHLGKDFDSLQKELGAMPASAEALTRALTANPELASLLRQWIDESRRLKRVRDELTEPQQLAALMKANGVPTTPEEIANNRIQTRWLLGLALLVAFVGILNAMLMSVTERFREIGTMKCLGALDGFIVKLFLLESLFQGVVGTLIGVALGLGLSLGAAALTYGRHAFINLPIGQLFGSVAVSLGIGIGLTVAGAVYPAWQAARMQPVEAMRVET